MLECSSLCKRNSNRPRLIFLHGFSGCKEDWEPILSCLSSSYECIAIDLPGHGGSAYREGIIPYLRTLLQTDFEEKPILIGYSMGGRIAMQLKDTAKAVIAISAHPGLTSSEERAQQAEREAYWKQKLLTLTPQQFFREWYAEPLFASLADTPGLIDKLIQQKKQQNLPVLAQVLTQLSLAKQPCVDLFSTPLLLIYGKKDSKYQQLYHNITVATPVLSLDDAHSAHSLKVHGIENAGHACLIENPQECHHTIHNYLKRLYAYTSSSHPNHLESRSSL